MFTLYIYKVYIYMHTYILSNPSKTSIAWLGGCCCALRAFSRRRALITTSWDHTHTHTHHLYTRRSALPGKSSEWREAHRPSLYASTFSVRAYRAFSTECFCVFVSVGARRMFGGAQLMEFSLRARAAKQRTRIWVGVRVSDKLFALH